MSTQENSVDSSAKLNSVSKDTAAAAHTMTEKLASAAHDAIDSTGPKLDKLEQKVRETASSAGKTLHDKKEASNKAIHEGIDSARGFAQRNPFLTLGAAFTAGVLVASLIGKKK